MSPMWHYELGFLYIDAKIPRMIYPIRMDECNTHATQYQYVHTIHTSCLIENVWSCFCCTIFSCRMWDLRRLVTRFAPIGLDGVIARAEKSLFLMWG